MTMIAVRHISEAEFASMREAWNELLARTPHDTPMLTWEWMFTWWEQYRASKLTRELYVLAAHDTDRRLVGIAPFVRRPAKSFGVPLRRMEFIGTGEAEEDETCSEYLDWIVEPTLADDVAHAIAGFILEDGGWDEIVCRDRRTDIPSPTQRLKSQAGVRGFFVAEFGSARCPHIVLPESWESYLSTLSRNSRRLVRYKRRRLLEAADVRFRSTRIQEEIEQRFPKLVELHQERWRGQGKSGCFASPVFRAFLQKAAARLAERSAVQLSWLEADGEVVAAYCLLRQSDKLFYYTSGVGIDRFEEHSPGQVCQGFIIEEAIKERMAEYHFFKGGEDSYKYHWTDAAVPVSSLRIRRQGWRHSACQTFEHAWEAARVVRNRFRRARPPSSFDSEPEP